MKLPDDETIHRVLYVLHKALADLRYLAKGGKNEQAYELGDTLENIPGLLTDWKDGNLEKIEAQLKSYHSKYGQICWCEYAKYLRDESPPERF